MSSSESSDSEYSDSGLSCNLTNVNDNWARQPLSKVGSSHSESECEFRSQSYSNQGMSEEEKRMEVSSHPIT